MSPIFRLLIERGATRHQAEIGVLVCEGLSNAAIADRLYTAETTIKGHLTGVFKAVGVKSRLELAVFCLQAVLKKTESHDVRLPVGKIAI